MRTLVVMVKAPLAGRVKTRLARDIGSVAAVWWYRHQVARTLRSLRDPRWRMVLAVTPDSAAGAGFWPAGVLRRVQGTGDLGVRMRRQMTVASRGPVVLIGSDIPGVSRWHVWRAFQGLGRADAVFGPAEDGGFWLVGLRCTRRTPPNLFEGVRWSGPHTLGDTLKTLGGLSHTLTDVLRDVDTGEDLASFRNDGSRSVVIGRTNDTHPEQG